MSGFRGFANMGIYRRAKTCHAKTPPDLVCALDGSEPKGDFARLKGAGPITSPALTPQPLTIHSRSITGRLFAFTSENDMRLGIGIGLNNFRKTGTGGTGPIISAPVNSALPTISGTTTQGQTLTAATGTWSNSPSSYDFQWKRNGSNISGATSQTYMLALADVGATITVAVTASNAGGTSAAATSAATAAIASSGPAPATLAAGQWGSAYSQAASVSTLGAGPYTITGLPYGLTGTVSSGVLTVAGTPE